MGINEVINHDTSMCILIYVALPHLIMPAVVCVSSQMFNNVGNLYLAALVSCVTAVLKYTLDYTRRVYANSPGL